MKNKITFDYDFNNLHQFYCIVIDALTEGEYQFKESINNDENIILVGYKMIDEESYRIEFNCSIYELDTEVIIEYEQLY